jgi:hypothetical protein
LNNLKKIATAPPALKLFSLYCARAAAPSTSTSIPTSSSFSSKFFNINNNSNNNNNNNSKNSNEFLHNDNFCQGFLVSKYL